MPACELYRYEVEGYATIWQAHADGLPLAEATQQCCLEFGHQGQHEFVSPRQVREAWERAREAKP